eukprot:jgi/Chrzof1/7635/Cz02g31030.t1
MSGHQPYAPPVVYNQGAYGQPAPYGPPSQQLYGQPPPYGQQPQYGAPAPPGWTAPAGNHGWNPPPAPPNAPQYMPPTSYSPNPQGPATGRKKALLVGCCYPGSSAALNGCINDVQCIQYCLKKNFGFQDSNIVALRDDQQHPDFVSTRANIMRAIQWLMSDQRPGDSLFFHFSGHGSQKTDYNGDEDDG